MSLGGHISLIDLTKQFPFQIDEKLKKQLCFGETLLISCGHATGDVSVANESDSDWTCAETEESEVEKEPSLTETIEIKDQVEEEQEPEEDDDDSDFHFYFFPDCTKPPQPKTSKESIITVNGMPKLNPRAKEHELCTCNIDKSGECECFVKLPCKCGAKTRRECKCKDLERICICKEVYKPKVDCTCRGSQICVCDPSGQIKPICTCDKIDKPCICPPSKFPCPVCVCKSKPKYELWKDLTGMGDDGKPETTSVSSVLKYGEESAYGPYGMDQYDYEEIPCECQKPDPPPRCFCRKGKKCICNKDTCVCGVIPTCICEPTDDQPTTPTPDDESYCSCAVVKACTCDAKDVDCKCFPKRPVCICGSPDVCKCHLKCDCPDPCICDTFEVCNEQECICFKRKSKDEVCTCPCKTGPPKLKRVRAGKQGYRWKHDVDPHHTYFDFAYGLHDKIDYKFQEKEKLKILGLYDEVVDVSKEECPIHKIIVPEYKKKIRKPSLDCCSTVGGISISIETLGEEADKFLVQVVSNSSKEGAITGTKLICIADSNLHTLEENRIEYITKNDMTKERRSYMGLCENGYYNKVTRICGEHSVVKRIYHTFEVAGNFLLEGANILLLRYLGLRRYKGTLKTETVLMNGTICESIYFSPGVSQGIVNNTPIFVVKIERHIIEPNGVIHQTLTIVTLRGYIVSHEWADNNYIMHLNPLLKVDSVNDEIERHSALRETWREDMQLLSDYLDFKTTRTGEGARYMSENGSLTATVKDYLQAILLLKPADVRHFTRHYFSSVISSLDLPHDDYFDACPKHVRYFYFEE